jgi:hypothetical protein
MLLIVLVVLGGLALLVTSVSIIAMTLMLIQTIRDQRDILTLEKINTGRIGGIEKLLIVIHTMLVSEIAQAQVGMPPTGPLPPWQGGMQIGHRGGKFVTEDGRHEADTFEELIQKISADPRYRVAKDEDVDKLREQFENHAREMGEEMGEEPEDENEGDEWKEGDPKEDES